METAEIIRALALVMVIEGIMPFAFPNRWKQAMLMATQMDSRILRVMGLASMLAGVMVLQLI